MATSGVTLATAPDGADVSSAGQRRCREHLPQNRPEQRAAKYEKRMAEPEARQILPVHRVEKILSGTCALRSVRVNLRLTLSKSSAFTEPRWRKYLAILRRA